MATEKQKLGKRGELLVKKTANCPKCKKAKTFRLLPINFKCADIICDFCGYLAQVKTKTVSNIEQLPKNILGGAWGVQKSRMDSGIYFPLYLVLEDTKKNHAVYYLPADFQDEGLFIARKPLSEKAKRAGWQGFYYDFSSLTEGKLVRLR